MKKQGVTFFVLRALARHLQHQADTLFRLVGEEERVAPRMPTKQEGQPARHRSNAEAEIPPAHWLAKNDAAGPPAHWLKRVQQTVPASRARTDQHRALPIEPGPTNRQRSDNDSDALILLETAAPSADTWDMPIAWPTAEAGAALLTENEAQRPISSALQLEESAKNVCAPTRAGRTVNVADTAPASTPGNAPSSPREPSSRRISPVGPDQSGSSSAAPANREPVPLSTLAPGSTIGKNAREFVVAQEAVPQPCKERDGEVAPQQEAYWANHARDTTEAVVLFARPVEQGASQPPSYGSRHAPQTASTEPPIGEKQASSTVEPRLFPPPVAQVNDDRRHTIDTHYYKNSSEQIQSTERHMMQEKWPDLPTALDLSQGAGAPGAHFSRSVDHSRWPTLSIPISAQQCQASDRAGEQSQSETGWPALPGEKVAGEWDWDKTRQVWEHQQRLNAEQRGYIWNA